MSSAAVARSPERPGPLMSVAGGSGLVPLRAMLRTRAAAVQRTPVRLPYSSRSPQHIIFRGELDQLAAARDGFTLTHTLTRLVPDGWDGERSRITATCLRASDLRMPERRARPPGSYPRTTH